jgi:membrane protease YdiL (CAAX protease family)
MRNWIKRHPFICFYVLAVAFPTLLYTYLILLEINAQSSGAGSIVEAFYRTQAEVRAAHPILAAHRDGVPTSILSYIAAPYAAPFLFFPFAPTISALLIVWLGWGGRGVVGLLGAYKPVRGNIGVAAGARIYLALAGLLGASVAAIIAAVHFSGGEELRAAVASGFGLSSWPTLVSALLVGFFANQGGLLEELGWRGFAWPILVNRFGAPLLAALVLGVCWALWHFPREIPGLLTGRQNLVDLLIGQGVFIVMCCSMTIVAVYFVNITGGSVWPAIMVHGALNLFGGAMAVTQEGTRSSFLSPNVLIWIAAALLMLLVVGPDLGWRQRREAHGGDGSSDPSTLWAQR